MFCFSRVRATAICCVRDPGVVVNAFIHTRARCFVSFFRNDDRDFLPRRSEKYRLQGISLRLNALVPRAYLQRRSTVHARS